MLKMSAKVLALFKVMVCVCATCGTVYAFKRAKIRPTGLSHGLCTSCGKGYKKDIQAFKEAKGCC